MPPKKAGAKAPRGAKAYGMAAELSSGEILVDSLKKKWTLGKAFAKGGFGRIYTATMADDSSKKVFVVKMEPAENGPLFQETHVYQRIAKPEAIESWRRSHGVEFLGVPPYVGSGRHVDSAGRSYRFLVMHRYGQDLEKMRVSSGGKLDAGTVFAIAKTCLRVFEFLHDQHYTHADLKAENLLLKDASARNPSEVFLVDYGLARKIPDNPVYKADKKKAHDGTLIFTSLDAHDGVPPSYRGDIEILSYNILYWLTGSLPWISMQDKPEAVAARKIAFYKNLDAELKKMLPAGVKWFDAVKRLVEYSRFLEYEERPDYELLRKILDEALKSSGGGTPKKGKRPTKALVQEEEGEASGSGLAPKNGSRKRTPSPVPPQAKRVRAPKSVVIPETPPSAKAEARKAKPSAENIPGRANIAAVVSASTGLAPLVLRKTDGSIVTIPRGGAVKHRMSMEASILKKYLRRKSVLPIGKVGKAKSPTKKERKAPSKGKKKIGEGVESSTQTSPNLWTAKRS